MGCGLFLSIAIKIKMIFFLNFLVDLHINVRWTSASKNLLKFPISFLNTLDCDVSTIPSWFTVPAQTRR